MRSIPFAAARRPGPILTRQAAKWLIFLAVLAAVMLFLPHDAWAQASTTTADTTSTGTGDTLYANFKTCLFSGWGMLFAGVVIVAGIYIWVKRGIGEGMTIMIGGFAMFLIPALILGAKNFGQTLAS
jgi:hypothetical protein